MSGEERIFTVVASKTITATFHVYAEDEEDAKDQVELTVSDFGIDVPDAYKLALDEWDVLSVEEQA